MRKRRRRWARLRIKPEIRARIIKPIGSVAVLLLVLAVILATSSFLEQQQQNAITSKLEEEQKHESLTLWTEENTMAFNGDLYGFDDRIETYPLIGTDESGGLDSVDGMYRGPMADFLMLLVMDHTVDTIGYIMIDRNTVTQVRELDLDGKEIASRELQICTAHWFGRSPEMAAENTEYAVRQFLGGLDHIDGYFVLSLKNIAKLNHSVGGVEVQIQDDMSELDPALYEGHILTLSDEQAEKYLRARTGVGRGDNASRMRRQMEYMYSLFSKVRVETATNPKFALRMYEALREAGTTDMTGNDFSRIAQKLLLGEDKGFYEFDGVTIEGHVLQDGETHEEFYADDTSMRRVMSNLFSLIPLKFGEDYGK